MKKSQLIFSTIALVAVVLMATSSQTQGQQGLNQANQAGNSQLQANGQAIERPVLRWEYAQLKVIGDPSLVAPDDIALRWFEGNFNVTPQPVSIRVLNNRLGRRTGGRSTFSNLLNSIGFNGWELIESTPNADNIRTWTFKRLL